MDQLQAGSGDEKSQELQLCLNLSPQLPEPLENQAEQYRSPSRTLSNAQNAEKQIVTCFSRQNSLISSLVLTQNSSKSIHYRPSELIHKERRPGGTSHGTRPTNAMQKTLASERVKAEQLQQQQLMNPWSSVLGGQSKRYFRIQQQRQLAKRQSANNVCLTSKNFYEQSKAQPHVS